MNQKQRDIPFLIKTQLIFGQPLTYVGLFVFAFGFIFVLIFLPNSDFQSIRFNENSPIIDGNITKIESTNASENKKKIYAYHYICSLGDGISYRTKVNAEVGDLVAVEHVLSNPKIHRIKGMRNKPFSMLVTFFVMIFPLIGVLLAIGGIYKGIKAAYILGYGDIGYGKYLGAEATNTTINNRRVYRMFFEFKTKDGQTHSAIATTNLPRKLTDEQTEQLLYLPDKPEQNFLLDEFSNIAKFDTMGYLNFKVEAKYFLSLILPTIILIEIYFFIMIFR